jgi:predicted nucleic acid-binding protein
MRYFDASALAKRCIYERGSEAVRRLMETDARAACRLSEVEVVSGLARLARSGVLTVDQRDRAIKTLELSLQAMMVVELTREITLRTRPLLQRNRLRAGDAIQLASCLDLQDRLGLPVQMVSFDDRLNEAAAAEGLTIPKL